MPKYEVSVMYQKIVEADTEFEAEVLAIADIQYGYIRTEEIEEDDA